MHTKEPWQDDPRGHGVVTDSNRRTVCTANFASDARRIVACVNAVAGVPTEWLESFTLRNVDNVVQENAKLKQQRDELLSALISLEQAYSNSHSPQHRSACLIEARAIIAKAEAA